MKSGRSGGRGATQPKAVHDHEWSLLLICDMQIGHVMYQVHAIMGVTHINMEGCRSRVTKPCFMHEAHAWQVLPTHPPMDALTPHCAAQAALHVPHNHQLMTKESIGSKTHQMVRSRCTNQITISPCSALWVSLIPLQEPHYMPLANMLVSQPTCSLLAFFLTFATQQRLHGNMHCQVGLC